MQCSPRLPRCRAAGAVTAVIFDPGPGESFGEVAAWANVDILTAHEGDAAALVGKGPSTAAQVVAAAGVPVAIITRDAAGQEVDCGGRAHPVPAVPTAVADTIGAGDAFSGALAAGLERGLGPIAAVQHACFCVSRMFCIPSCPALQDVPWR